MLHVDTNKAGKLVFIESWTDKPALDAHMQTAHFKTLAGQLEELVDGGASAVTIDVLKKIA